MTEYLAIGNWKMNTSLEEAVDLIRRIRLDLDSRPLPNVTVVICPPFTWLTAAAKALQGSGIKLGAQNLYFQPNGAFTGEISAAMISEISDYVIVGHSERRHIIRESYTQINQKMNAAISAGLSPVLCVGETLGQRQRNSAEAVVRRQISSALNGVSSIEKLIIAYEPVWAIGTGVPASPAAVRDITGGAIRDEIRRLYIHDLADEVPVLYGGSVNPQNVAGFLEDESVDGTLIGGASLQADQFAQIARLTGEIKGKLSGS